MTNGSKFSSIENASFAHLETLGWYVRLVQNACGQRPTE